MSNTDLEYLFKPGAGVVPPYLAGRQEEQEYFGQCVKALKNRKPVSQDLIIYGPRGNGKTALLSYLQKQTLRKEGKKLDIQWVTPGRMETPAEFDNTLTGKKRFRSKFRKLVASVAYLSASAGIELDLSGSVKAAEDQIKKKCKKKPFILIIDEAHTLKPEVGRALLNASQTVRGEGHPFLLVLAGTPNLMAALEKTNASFWDRSALFPLGRLSAEESEEAITIPLGKAGIFFAPGAAEEIAKRAHRYPFFLQIWGDCLARKLGQTGETEITLDTVQAVTGTVIRKRDLMYQTRFDEIERKELLSVARCVADAFIQTGKPHKPHLHGNILKEAIRKGLSGDDEPVTNKRILENLDQLYQLGYIWRAEGANYEPGIPSLMTYVHKNASRAQ